MSNLKFLGKGLQYPFIFASSGGAKPSSSATESEGIEHVKQALIQVLKTSIGERVMKRDFGSSLQQLVFQPQQQLLLTQIVNAVKTAVETWEKRVIVKEIKVLELNPKDGKIEISISFKIISTNVEGNLVYPFYLQSPEKNVIPPPSGVVEAQGF